MIASLTIVFIVTVIEAYINIMHCGDFRFSSMTRVIQVSMILSVIITGGLFIHIARS